jgi:YidC/Oxa1 family membrane protein insertase
MSDALSSATSSLSDAGAAAADAVVSAVPPALPVDMATAGLTDWTPAGLVCSLFETIQTTTGYSWVPTLAIATVGIRVALLWPQIRSMRAAARIQPHQARIEQLQAESLAAARAKDMLRAQELSRERTEIYQRAGVRVSDMLLAPIAMLPAQLGLFFAAKRLAEMPWPSLASESWMWIPSLAAADPLWLLPVLNTVAIQMQLYISLQDAATEKAAHTVNALRAMSVAGVPVLLGFSSVCPSGLSCAPHCSDTITGGEPDRPLPVAVRCGAGCHPSHVGRPSRPWVARDQAQL